MGEVEMMEFLYAVNRGMVNIWYQVITNNLWIELAMAIPLVLSPIIKIVHFILGQINSEAEGGG